MNIVVGTGDQASLQEQILLRPESIRGPIIEGVPEATLKALDIDLGYSRGLISGEIKRDVERRLDKSPNFTDITVEDIVKRYAKRNTLRLWSQNSRSQKGLVYPQHKEIIEGALRTMIKIHLRKSRPRKIRDRCSDANSSHGTGAKRSQSLIPLPNAPAFLLSQPPFDQSRLERAQSELQNIPSGEYDDHGVSLRAISVPHRGLADSSASSAADATQPQQRRFDPLPTRQNKKKRPDYPYPMAGNNLRQLQQSDRPAQTITDPNSIPRDSGAEDGARYPAQASSIQVMTQEKPIGAGQEHQMNQPAESFQYYILLDGYTLDLHGLVLLLQKMITHCQTKMHECRQKMKDTLVEEEWLRARAGFYAYEEMLNKIKEESLRLGARSERKV